MRILALTVTDRNFFAGTVAAVNSLLHYAQNWPKNWTLAVRVVTYGTLPPEQIAAFEVAQNFGVKLLPQQLFSKPERLLGAWQLKSYAAADLITDCDCLIGFDSDLVFCSDVADVLKQAIEDGNFYGGADYADASNPGITYPASYAVYGITPGLVAPYMSTSCYFCAARPNNVQILQDCAVKTNKAAYGPQAEKIYPGHGDQGVLNAVIAAATGGKNVKLLPNRLWSQHGPAHVDRIEFDDNRLVNVSAGGVAMRTLHACGSIKFWTPRYSAEKLGALKRWPYAQFLRFLYFGAVPCISAARFKHLPRAAAALYPAITELDPTIKEKELPKPLQLAMIAKP